MLWPGLSNWCCWCLQVASYAWLEDKLMHCGRWVWVYGKGIRGSPTQIQIDHGVYWVKCKSLYLCKYQDRIPSIYNEKTMSIGWFALVVLSATYLAEWNTTKVSKQGCRSQMSNLPSNAAREHWLRVQGVLKAEWGSRGTAGNGGGANYTYKMSGGCGCNIKDVTEWE